MKKAIVIIPLIWSMFGPGYTLLANEGNVSQTAKEGVSDVKKTVRKGVRKSKDKTCELVNGKMECAAKKLKHKAQNVGDDINDKMDD
jgi:hypothetical protein